MSAPLYPRPRHRKLSHPARRLWSARALAVLMISPLGAYSRQPAEASRCPNDLNPLLPETLSQRGIRMGHGGGLHIIRMSSGQIIRFEWIPLVLVQTNTTQITCKMLKNIDKFKTISFSWAELCICACSLLPEPPQVRPARITSDRSRYQP